MSEYVARYDIWVTQERLPMRVHAFCKTVGMDDCAVVNEDLADEKKRDAVDHEVRHLRRGDLHSENNVRDLEEE